MTNADITVDAQGVLNLFANLSPKKQKRAIKGALKKGAQILQKETRTRLRRSGIKGVSKRSKWGTSLVSGVKYKVDREASSAKVHIMGDFRLKFFEMGTNIRQTRKGYNRGKIQDKYNFFSEAKAAKEREIFDNMNRLISESIKKVAKNGSASR